MSAILEVKNLRKAYSDGFEALKGFNTTSTCAGVNLTGVWREVNSGATGRSSGGTLVDTVPSTLFLVHRLSALDAEVAVLFDTDRRVGRLPAASVGRLRSSKANCVLFMMAPASVEAGWVDDVDRRSGGVDRGGWHGEGRIEGAGRIEWSSTLAWERTSSEAPRDDGSAFDGAATMAAAMVAYFARLGERTGKTILAASSCDSAAHAAIAARFDGAHWSGLYAQRPRPTALCAHRTHDQKKEVMATGTCRRSAG